MKQEDDLKAWVGATRQIGAWINQEFGLVYESRSGLIALLHRLDLEYHKPDAIPRKRDEDKQNAFIASDENRLNSLAGNEALLVGDADRIQLVLRAPPDRPAIQPPSASSGDNGLARIATMDTSLARARGRIGPVRLDALFTAWAFPGAYPQDEISLWLEFSPGRRLHRALGYRTQMGLACRNGASEGCGHEGQRCPVDPSLRRLYLRNRLGSDCYAIKLRLTEPQ